MFLIPHVLGCGQHTLPASLPLLLLLQEMLPSRVAGADAGFVECHVLAVAEGAEPGAGHSSCLWHWQLGASGKVKTPNPYTHCDAGH